MVVVKILKIGKEFTVNVKNGNNPGPKQKVGIVCVEQSTKTEYDGTMWLEKEGIWFKVGDELIADIEVNGQYVNIKKLKKMETPPAPPAKVEKPKDAVPQEVWDKKDRMIVRQNVLSHSTEIVKAHLDYLTLEEKKPMQPLDIANMVELVAEQLEAWIYRNGLKESV
jgi:hypothetical protein